MCKPVQVEYLASIGLTDKGWDVNMLEEACLKAAGNLLRSFSSEHRGKWRKVQTGYISNKIDRAHG
jgi:hypothetical protein